MRDQMLETADGMLKDALRGARADAKTPRLDLYVTDLDKHLLGGTDKVKACAKILRSLREKFDRGASQAALEEFWMLGLAITRAWFTERTPAAIDPSDLVAVRRELARLHLAEQRAQGEREAAEAALAHDPSTPNMERWLTAQAQYVVADTQLRDFVREHHVRRRFRAARTAGQVTVVRGAAARSR